MIRLMLCLLLMLSSSWSVGDAYVIFDNGKTVDIRSYYEPFVLVERAKKNKVHKPSFPVITPNLSPGSVEYEDAYFPKLAKPICLVGDDRRSVEWMRQHKADLIKHHVSCWMVSAASREHFQSMKSLAAGIALYLGNAEDIARYFGIKHYPVLIDSRYIAQ